MDIKGSFFREQAIAVAKQGAQVGVIAATFTPLRSFNLQAERGSLERHEVDCGVNTLRVNRRHITPRMPRLTSIRHASRVRGLFDRYLSEFGKPDIVHLHAALPAGLSARMILDRAQVPFVYSEHSSAFARGMVSKSGVKLARDCALRASAAFAVSSPYSRILDEQLNLPAGYFGVMPNSVDSRFLTNSISYPIQGHTRFVHISNLADVKNVDILLQSFAKAFLGNTSCQLTIAGHGSNLEYLRRLSDDLGLADQVAFVGPLPREAVPDLLMKSDVFVLPSKTETFGVVAIEALAMGLQVIASRCGGPEDIVQLGDGSLVAPDSVAALAEALATAVPDDLATRLARRDRCRKRFGSELISSKWLAIYDRLLG